MKIPKDEIERLIGKYNQMNRHEWDVIQDILGKKELGNLDINLDIEMKVRNNIHHVLVEVIHDFEALIKDYQEEKGA